MNNHDSHQRNRYSIIKNHTSPKKKIFISMCYPTYKQRKEQLLHGMLSVRSRRQVPCLFAFFSKKIMIIAHTMTKEHPALETQKYQRHLHKKEQKLSLVTNRYGTLKKQYILEE